MPYSYALLVIIILLPTAISEIKQLSLTDPGSSLYYEPFTWHVADPLRLILNFETNTAGRILTLLAKNQTYEVAYALAIDVRSGGTLEVFQRFRPLVTMTSQLPTTS